MSGSSKWFLYFSGLPLILFSGLFFGVEMMGPMSVDNQNPFSVIYGSTRCCSGRVLDEGVSESGVGYHVSSNFQRNANSRGGLIIIDGESEVWTLSYRRGFAGDWEAGLVLPIIEHSGGYLDRLIVNWHDWFGMPQGGRDAALNSQVELHDRKSRSGVRFFDQS